MTPWSNCQFVTVAIIYCRQKVTVGEPDLNAWIINRVFVGRSVWIHQFWHNLVSAAHSACSSCRKTTEVTGKMDTALWLVAITFLTVGYGDVSPKTTCGKAVCLFTGVMVIVPGVEKNTEKQQKCRSSLLFPSALQSPKPNRDHNKRFRCCC